MNKSKLAECLKAVCPAPSEDNNFGLQHRALFKKKFGELQKILPKVRTAFEASSKSYVKGYQDWMDSLLKQAPNLNKPVDKLLHPYSNLLLMQELEHALSVAQSQGQKDLSTREKYDAFFSKLLKRTFPMLSQKERDHIQKLREGELEKPYAKRIYDPDPVTRYKVDHPGKSLEVVLLQEFRKRQKKLKTVGEKFPGLINSLPEYQLMLEAEEPILKKVVKKEELSSSQLVEFNYQIFLVDQLYDVYVNKKENQNFHQPPPLLSRFLPKEPHKIFKQVKEYFESEEFKSAVKLEAGICAATLFAKLSKLPSAKQLSEAKKKAREARNLVKENWTKKMSEVSKPLFDRRLDEREYKLPPSPESFKALFLKALDDNVAFAKAYDKTYQKVRNKALTQQMDLASLYQPSRFDKKIIVRDIVGKSCADTRSWVWADSNVRDLYNGLTNEAQMSADIARNPKIAPSVCSHEYGHAVDPGFLSEEEQKKLSDVTKVKVDKVKQCLIAQHKGRNGEVFVGEDFADLVSVQATGESGDFCFDVPDIAFRNPPDDLARYLILPVPGDNHSSLLFRILHQEFLVQGKIPGVCREVMKSNGVEPVFGKGCRAS